MPHSDIHLSPSHPLLITLARKLADGGIPHDAKVIYRGRNTIASIDGINIKEYARPGLVKAFIYGCLRTTKAARAYANAERLTSMGFTTAEPFGFIEIRNGKLLTRSYFISSQLEGYSDVRFLQHHPDRDEIIASMATLLAHLHDAGVYMKDFSPGNVLYRRDDSGELQWALIDINRMAFDCTDSSLLMRNLAQILDLDDDVVRLAKAYASRRGLDVDATVATALTLRHRKLRSMARNRKLKKLFR